MTDFKDIGLDESQNFNSALISDEKTNEVGQVTEEFEIPQEYRKLLNLLEEKDKMIEELLEIRQNMEEENNQMRKGYQMQIAEMKEEKERQYKKLSNFNKFNICKMERMKKQLQEYRSKYHEALVTQEIPSKSREAQSKQKKKSQQKLLQSIRQSNSNKKFSQAQMEGVFGRKKSELPEKKNKQGKPVRKTEVPQVQKKNLFQAEVGGRDLSRH